VRFAAECLAFANPPQGATVQDLKDKVGVPRDLGTDWDFADTREHYLQRLHGYEPEVLREADPERYLQLSQLVAGQTMEASFAEWRRARSTCRGALVWTFKDLAPGAGWGVVDDTGAPKACWYALKRAFRPLHLALTDEGNSGLAIHMVNESADALDLELELAALLPDGRIDGQAKALAPLAPREAVELNAWSVLGAFYDLNGAYRFGPLRHCMVVCRLRDRAGDVVAEAFHLPERAPAFAPAEVQARLDGSRLILTTDRPVRFVRVVAPGCRPSDDGFHLAPGADKVVTLTADGSDATLKGRVTALDQGLLTTFG
jgi:beta-mannosidase